jgi:transcriptional regulator with XRE-family HTH domain
MTREEFGDRFRAAREAAGLTQAAAAERLGISRPRISEIEAGRFVPSFIRVVEIVERLGLDAKILLPEWFNAAKAKVKATKRRPR